MTASLIKRQLAATFQLAQGIFTGSNGDTLTLAGLRMSARINKAGALSGATLDLSIYGMTLSQMNDLCTLGIQVRLISSGNLILLQAGDADSGMSTVFEGVILDAYADFEDMPNVVFRVTANSVGAVQPMDSTSIPGPYIDVPQVMAQIAATGGFSIFDNSVGILTIPGPIYLHGSPKEQMDELAQMAHIGWGVDDKTVAIWPIDGARATPFIPSVSANSGLIGYPGFTANGIIIKTLFNPAIIFQGLIQVQSAYLAQIVNDLANKPVEASQFFPANGVWAISEIDHYLDSKVVGGYWHSIVACYNPKYSPPGVNSTVLHA